MPEAPAWLDCTYTVSRPPDAKRFHLGIGIGRVANFRSHTFYFTDQAEQQLSALQALSGDRVGLCLISSDGEDEIGRVLDYGFGRVADGQAVLVLCPSEAVGAAVWSQLRVEQVH